MYYISLKGSRFASPSLTRSSSEFRRKNIAIIQKEDAQKDLRLFLKSSIIVAHHDFSRYN